MFFRKSAALGLAAFILLAPLGCATRKHLAVNMACGNFANYRCDKFTKVCSKQEGDMP
jgi:hypothetical protein